MTRREGILTAVREAAALLGEVPVGARTSFDIIGAVVKLNIPLVFRPLDRLWGACLTVKHKQSGIMVSTKLGLSVQRFTIAHELGHAMLGHELSLDETVGFAGRYGPRSRPVDEVAADTFALELLAPKNLVRSCAQRQGWNKKELCQAENIYQLAIRLGISYEAACWALTTWNVVTRTEAANLARMSLQELKQALAPESLITNPRADVWDLTPTDSGTFLEAGPDDLFVLHLQDHASAGHVWRLADANGEAEIIDERHPDLNHSYGEPSERVLYVRFRASGMHRLVFEHIRPWSRETLATVEIEVDGYGREGAGWPRRMKPYAIGQGQGQHVMDP